MHRVSDFQSKKFVSPFLSTQKEYKIATVRKEIVKAKWIKKKKRQTQQPNLVSPFLLILFPLLFPIFRTRNAQPRCRAASHPIFNGYGKLILSNAILRRGYLPIPMDTAQVSPFPVPIPYPFWIPPTPNRKSLSLTQSLTLAIYHSIVLSLSLSLSPLYLAFIYWPITSFYGQSTRTRL
jgi:hypothetical protein